MAAEDFNSAKDRLEKAKKETMWIVGVSNDPAIHTQEYNLIPEEQKALLLESQKHLVEIQKAIEQLRIGAIPPWPDPSIGEEDEEAKRGRAGRNKPAQQNEDRS